MTTNEGLTGYLHRLGYDAAPPPTLEHLRALHRAHLERIPYDDLGIMTGTPPAADPAPSVARVAEDDLVLLWTRSIEAHRAWDAAGRP